MQVVFVAIALVFLFWGAKVVDRSGRCLDKSATSTINGFFICLVFLSHFSQYASGYMVNYVGRWLEQLVVVMFLFYSGYGCMEQLNIKGAGYLAQFPKKRMLTTLVNFDIAIVAFVIVGLLLGKSFSVKQIALSLVCWDSVGNSNWYIFAILACYAAFYCAFRITNCIKLPIGGGGGLCIVFLVPIILFLHFTRPTWWFDTIMAFGAGVVYSNWNSRIEEFLKKFYWLVLPILIVGVVFEPYIPVLGPRHWLSFNIKSVLFAIAIVMVTMKVEFNSPILKWCGENLFPLYIYQRIPMIVFSSLHPEAFQDWRCWIYCVLSMSITIAIAFAYPKFRYPFALLQSLPR